MTTEILVKNIKTIGDLNFILKGIQIGAKNDKAFTLHSEREYLKKIMSHDVNFYIFYTEISKETYIYIGFGAIKYHKEIAKVFVYPEFRGLGYGTYINSWLSLRCLQKYDTIPVWYVKKGNNKMLRILQKQGVKTTRKTQGCFVCKLYDYMKFGKSLLDVGLLKW